MNTQQPTAAPEHHSHWPEVKMPTHVGWESIFQQSLCYLAPVVEWWQMDNLTALRDLRTIHMGGGRQNGKTEWAVTKLADEGTIIVAKDKYMRQAIDRMYTLKNLRESITITIPADCPDPYEVVEGLLKEYHKVCVPNVFTAMDLATIIKNEPEKLKHVTKVIIDEASYNTKIHDIYRSLVELKRPDLIIVALG